MNEVEQPLLRVLEDGVLTITLNRPERLNALTVPLMRQLEQTLRHAASDPDTRVVLLRGAGRGFCSGGDLRDGRKDDEAGDRPKTDPAYGQAEQRYERMRGFAEASVLLHDMLKPTIAVVRGAASGAGLSLATACDFRIASETAFFIPNFIRAGFSGDFGGSYFLTRLLGPTKTRQLYMLNERIEASEALQLGLVTKVHPDEELDVAAAAFARHLANQPRVALRYMKQNLNFAENNTLPEVMDLETRNMVRTGETADHKEAVRAMLDKRDPLFPGY